MTTLKLNKTPPEHGEGASASRKKPLRSHAPELRDRSQPPAAKPAKANKPVNSESSRPARPASKPAANRSPERTQRSAGSDPRKTAPAQRSQKSFRPSIQATSPGHGKRPQQTEVDSDALPRLSKVMADRGICSRREADEWIVNGWVKVNGEIIETLGTRIDPEAEIIISTYAKEHQAETVTILLHKPVGYVSGQAEDGYEPAVVLVNPDNQWQEDSSGVHFKRGHLRGLAPAGRLDIDSTGLLVLTQDGRVARKLIGDDSSVEKEYLVRVEGELSANGLALLNHGLSLDGVKLKPAKVSWQNEDQLRFVLREGRKRQIRRMCELVGLHVVGLKRIRIGSINLGKLPPGQWRYLAANERF